MPEMPKFDLTLTTHRRIRYTRAWPLALVFTLGEFWGHVGHHPLPSIWHIALSLVTSFACLVFIMEMPWADLRIIRSAKSASQGNGGTE